MKRHLIIYISQAYYRLILVILLFCLMFIPKIEAQSKSKENKISLNSTVSIPLIYKDRNFQSSIPIFFTGEFKLKQVSFTIGVGAEFGKYQVESQSEATTLANCPPMLPYYNDQNIIRCYYYIHRNSINLRFPIAFSYYFIDKKKFQTYFSSGIILDYSFLNHGSTRFFEYSTQQMKLLSNELKHENFRYNDFYYINYDVLLQLGAKYALTEKWFLHSGVQYSNSFEKFPLKYVNDEHKICWITGVSILLQ